MQKINILITYYTLIASSLYYFKNPYKTHLSRNLVVIIVVAFIYKKGIIDLKRIGLRTKKTNFLWLNLQRTIK